MCAQVFLLPDTEHRGEGPGTEGDAPLDWQPGYAAPRNRCKRALLGAAPRTPAPRLGWGRHCWRLCPQPRAPGRPGEEPGRDAPSRSPGSSRTSRRSGEPSPQPLPSQGKFRGDANLVCLSTVLSCRLPWDTHFCSNTLPRRGSRGPATRSLHLPRGRSQVLAARGPAQSGHNLWLK